jgi:hypothetical protein
LARPLEPFPAEARPVNGTSTNVADAEVIAQVASDPAWLPHRYDPEHDAVHFRRVERAVHRSLTFLTEAEIPADAPTVVLRRQDVAPGARSSAAPLHFVFHSAYCCSTLMARALDLDGVAMTLKEPQILNDLVGWRRRGGPPERVAAVLDDVLILLAQPFAPGERVIVKPSNVVNALAAPILQRSPSTHALLLHAPLPIYLASIAAKRMSGALWVREHFVGALRDGLVDLGFDSEQLFGQTDLQIAAMGWLAQQALFARLHDRFGTMRVQPLDSETLLAAKPAAIARTATLFGLALDRAQVARITAGPVFARHSKTGEAFGTADRTSAQVTARDIGGEELDRICQWTAEVAKRAGIPLVLASHPDA